MVKKEHLVKYGQDTGSVYVATVVIDVSDLFYLISQYGVVCKMKFRESIFLVDVYEGRYAQNSVYESDFTAVESYAVDYLLKKPQNDFRLVK